MKTLKHASVGAPIILAATGLFVFTSRAAQSATTDDSPGGKLREHTREKLSE